MGESQCLFSHGSGSNCTKGHIFKIIYFKVQIEALWIFSIFQDSSHDFLHVRHFSCAQKKDVGEAIHTHQWQRASREDDELQAAKRTPSGTEDPVKWWLQ